MFVYMGGCLSRILSFYGEVTKKVDGGKAVDFVHIDIGKELSVPHARLDHIESKEI